MGRPRLQWTPQAAAFAAGGIAMLVAGAMLGAAWLALLGGTLLLQVGLEALRVGARPPVLRLDPVTRRVPEESALRVHLEGEGLGPHQQLHVPLSTGLRLEAGESNLWHPTGPAGEHTFHAVAKARGPQQIGPVTVRHWSPLRLWAQDNTLPLEAKVEVVPRAAPVKRFGLLSRVVKPMQGRFQVNRPGQGFDFFTLRGYTPGDTMRSVNWKASARREDLIVNQRQLETHSEILILLDARTLMGVGPVGSTPLDRACRAALGLFEDAVSSRDTVRFVVYGDGLTELPQGGDRLQALEGLLARLPARGTTPCQPAWDQARRKMKSHGPVILLTSAELDFELPQVASDIVARGHPLTVLSPTPLGPDWEAAAPRREARAHILEGLRHRGAVVVDWDAGQKEAVAEKPSVRQVAT